jgi:hypothetical protein
MSTDTSCGDPYNFLDREPSTFGDCQSIGADVSFSGELTYTYVPSNDFSVAVNSPTSWSTVPSPGMLMVNGQEIDLVQLVDRVTHLEQQVELWKSAAMTLKEISDDEHRRLGHTVNECAAEIDNCKVPAPYDPTMIQEDFVCNWNTSGGGSRVEVPPYERDPKVVDLTDSKSYRVQKYLAEVKAEIINKRIPRSVGTDLARDRAIGEAYIAVLREQQALEAYERAKKATK